MAYTLASRRQRALAVIAAAKKPRRSLKTQAVANALATLSQLDEKRYSVTYETERPGNYNTETQHRATIHARIAGSGISLHGALVAVTDPPAPEDIDARLGWSEPTPDPTEQFNRAMKQTGELLHQIVLWLIGRPGSALAPIGLRSVALASMVAPHVFEDCQGSTTSIAERFGVTKQAVSKYVSELRDLAPGFQSRNMRDEDTREQHRHAARAQHQRAGHRMHTNAAA